MYIKRINNSSWYNGTYYYKDPECTILHREDGPAVEYADGDKLYYLNDRNISKIKYIEYIKSKSICPAKKSKILKRCV